MKNVFSLFLKTLNLGTYYTMYCSFIFLSSFCDLTALSFYHNGIGANTNIEMNNNGDIVFDNSNNIGSYDFETDIDNVLDKADVIYIDSSSGDYVNTLLPENFINWIENGGSFYWNYSNAYDHRGFHNKPFSQFIKSLILRGSHTNVQIQEEKILGNDNETTDYELIPNLWTGNPFSGTSFDAHYGTDVFYGNDKKFLITEAGGDATLIEINKGLGKVYLSGINGSPYVYYGNVPTTTHASTLFRNIFRYIRDSHQLPLPPVIQISDSYDVVENMSLTIDPVISSGFPENYTYQWYFEGFPIPPMFGGTGDSYTLTGDITLQGNWKLDITNDAGTTSKNFSVIVRADSDGDGIFDYKETNTGIWISENDTGTDPNNPDTDTDSYNDKDDLFPLDPNEWLDTDSDGVGDNADAFPSNPNETIDTDGDGLGNNTDTDDDGDSLEDTKELEFGTDPLIQDDFNSLIQLINSTNYSPRIEQSLYDSIVTQKDDAISRKNTLQASLDAYDNYTIPRIDINEVLTTWLGYTYDPIDDVHKVDPSVDVDQNKLQYLEHFRGILDSGPLSEEIKEDVVLGLRVAINHKISREYWKARAKSLPSQAQYDSAIAERDQARTERDARPSQSDIDAIIAERDAASNGLTSGHIPDSLSGLIEVYSWQGIDVNGLPIADQFGTNAVYYPNETVLQFSDDTSIFSGNYSWDKDTQTVTGVDETYSYTIIYEFFETSNTSIYMFNYKSYLSNLYDETQTELTDEGFGFMYDSEGDLNQNTVSDKIDFIGQSYFPDGNFGIYLTDKTTIVSNEVPDTLPQVRTLNMYSLDEIKNLSLGSVSMEIINGANTLLSSEIKEKNAQGNWTDIFPVSEQIPMEQNEDKKFYRFKIKDSIYETSSN